MTAPTQTQQNQYIDSWLLSKTAVSPLIIASYSSDALQETVDYVQTNNEDNDTLFLKEENGSYKIKETKELINTISRTSFTKQRLIIIQLAERLTLPAVNALLKSLEEPSVQNKWLLTTRQLPLILPTIRSRSQIIRINRQKDLSQQNLNPDFWQELLSTKKADNISDESLTELHTYLTQSIKEKGPSPHIYRVLLRLRDYHKIKSHRGNTKLARDVLLASLTQLRNN